MELDDCICSMWTKCFKRCWSLNFFCFWLWFFFYLQPRQRNEIWRFCRSGWKRSDGCSGSVTRIGPVLNPNRSTLSFLCTRCSRRAKQIKEVQSVLRFTQDYCVLCVSLFISPALPEHVAVFTITASLWGLKVTVSPLRSGAFTVYHT